MNSPKEILIETLTAARDDVEAFARQQQTGFVVAMKDSTPFRKAADGTIRLFGGELYVDTHVAAAIVARTLNAQNENVNPDPLPAAEWAVARVKVINDLIAAIKEQK